MADYDEILISIRRITRAIDLHSKKLLQKSGLTAPQLLVLQAIRKEGHVMPSVIARDVLLSQATITSIVDRLVKAGLVERRRDEGDRRTVTISLTEAGSQKLLAAPELLQDGFLREYRKLADWERTNLIAALQRVAAMMDADDLDAAPILDVGELPQASDGQS